MLKPTKTSMTSSAERLAVRLEEIMKNTPVRTISVYRFSDSKLFNESSEYSFGHEFLYVGGQYYNLGKLITYKVAGESLLLYF